MTSKIDPKPMWLAPGVPKCRVAACKNPIRGQWRNHARKVSTCSVQHGYLFSQWRNLEHKAGRTAGLAHIDVFVPPTATVEAREQESAKVYRLMTQLAEAKIRKEEMVRAVFSAAKDAFAGMEISPVAKPAALDRRDSTTRTPETAVLLMSDWQLAKRTKTYDSKVAERRVYEFVEKVVSLTHIQRKDHPVPRAHVLFLGDIVEGELIFPGQQHEIDASLFRQIVDGGRIIVNSIRRLLSYFEEVYVDDVDGNHGALGGRSRKEYHPETNADSLCYEIARQRLDGEPRVKWAPKPTGERNWYRVVEIAGHRWLLFHGDQVKGTQGFPWYGFGRKTSGLYVSLQRIYKQRGFDFAAHGHFHTPNRMYMNGITVFGNGSTESHNPYALEQLAAAGEPCQTLLFAHPKHGVTAEYVVRLTE